MTEVERTLLRSEHDAELLAPVRFFLGEERPACRIQIERSEFSAPSPSSAAGGRFELSRTGETGRTTGRKSHGGVSYMQGFNANENDSEADGCSPSFIRRG